MVGGGEGGGGASGGLTGWLIEMQSQLTRLIAADVHALHGDPAAIWGLVGFGFAYGVFHAAGPGHGKAVIASYMMASDRALKRGIVLAFLAAMLQGAVAVALVGVAALIFHATAAEMNAAADWLALASCSGVIAIGLWLTVTKGRALLAALKARFAHRAALAAAPVYADAPWRPAAVRAPPSRSAPARRTAWRKRRPTTPPPAGICMRPTRPRSKRAFPGAAPRRRCWRRVRGRARARSSCSSSPWRRGCSSPESARSSRCRSASR